MLKKAYTCTDQEKRRPSISVYESFVENRLSVYDQRLCCRVFLAHFHDLVCLLVRLVLNSPRQALFE